MVTYNGHTHHSNACMFTYVHHSNGLVMVTYNGHIHHSNGQIHHSTMVTYIIVWLHTS